MDRTLTESERAALMRRILREGEVQTAESVGVSKLTLMRGAAGLRMQRRTLELLRNAIERGAE